MMSVFDVVVVGGGIVGATMAIALAKKTNLHIALLDSKALTPNWKSGKCDHRVSSISLASKRIFEKLSVWDAIQSKRVSPYKKMHVWDANGDGSIHFDSKLIQSKELGYIIEDNVIRSSLLESIVDATSVHLFAPCNLVSLQENSDGMLLSTEDGNQLQARLVIAADGGNSWVREQVEIELQSWDYEHQAIVATVQTVLPHHLTARQRFLSTGPLAFLPLLDEHECSIVWSTSPAHAKELLALNDAAFQKVLAGAFDYQLGDIAAVSQRYSFPLTMRHAKKYVKERLALIGDAAHTIHPLAGLGVNLGLLDAVSLAEVIVDALTKNRDFASVSTLRRYERWRKGDNVAMLAFVEGIKYLFASDATAIKSMRNIGLNVTNQMHFLKEFFVKYAVGNRGDMPILAR